MSIKVKLTKHQTEVWNRISGLIRRGVQPNASVIGSRGACDHLQEKGLIVRVVHAVGPRGGEYAHYELTEAGRLWAGLDWCTAKEQS